jgi:hypothetical protein
LLRLPVNDHSDMGSGRSKVVTALGFCLLATLAAAGLITGLDGLSAGCTPDDGWEEGWIIGLGALACLVAPAFAIAAASTDRIVTSILLWVLLAPIAAVGALIAYVILVLGVASLC